MAPKSITIVMPASTWAYLVDVARSGENMAREFGETREATSFRAIRDEGQAQLADDRSENDDVEVTLSMRQWERLHDSLMGSRPETDAEWHGDPAIMSLEHSGVGQPAAYWRSSDTAPRPTRSRGVAVRMPARVWITIDWRADTVINWAAEEGDHRLQRRFEAIVAAGDRDARMPDGSWPDDDHEVRVSLTREQWQAVVDQLNTGALHSAADDDESTRALDEALRVLDAAGYMPRRTE